MVFLESITPKEFQIYVLIGTFIISLFIDIIFSIKRKGNKFFTISNYGIGLWIFIGGLGLYTYYFRLSNQWGMGTVLFQILSIIVPALAYFFVLLKFKLDIEKKDPDCYVNLLKYSLSHLSHLKIKKEVFIIGVLFSIVNIVFWAKMGTLWVGNLCGYVISIIFVIFILAFSYLYMNTEIT
jgi:hypothetical protein